MPKDDKDSRSMFHVRTHTQAHTHTHTHACKKWPNKSHKSPDNAPTHSHTLAYNKNTSQCNGNCMSQTNEMATAQT